jgi:transposase InsO family protein
VRAAGDLPVDGRPGSALDNAVIESWHSTLEFELRSVEHFLTRAAARARVSAWIQEYNTQRRPHAPVSRGAFSRIPQPSGRPGRIMHET